MDRVGSGKQWDLDRKRDGLFYSRQIANVIEDEFGSFAHFRRHIDYFLEAEKSTS